MGGWLSRRSDPPGDIALCCGGRPKTYRCEVECPDAFVYYTRMPPDTMRQQLTAHVGPRLVEPMVRLLPYWRGCRLGGGDGTQVIQWTGCGACVTDEVRAYFAHLPEGWRERIKYRTSYEDLRAGGDSAQAV